MLHLKIQTIQKYVEISAPYFLSKCQATLEFFRCDKDPKANSFWLYSAKTKNLMIAEKKKCAVEKITWNYIYWGKVSLQKKICIEIINLFCQINSALLEHIAYNSAKYDCQEFLSLCARFVQSGKLLHQYITKKNEIHFYLRVKINCIKLILTDKLNVRNIKNKTKTPTNQVNVSNIF